ncbi:hypothetical protein DFH06DRAFT_1090907 [Mycena polygramma]|nr:hypothetical protein DFH06DRAFT_1090907 [Mycena polygramma]
MSKFLNLPSATTVAESNPPRLIPSVGTPKAAEIAANISTFFPASTGQPKVGHCLMIDGLHLCQRCRWYRPTNQIIGLCREHSGELDLSMSTMDSVLAVLEAVHGDSPTCHYGREATVAAVAPFRSENYHGLPIVQTQTCKSEKGVGFTALLNSILVQWELHGGPNNGDLWVVGIDGDPVFREGAFKVLMCDEVRESDPLFAKLGGLKGLNRQCGKNKAVSGSDMKHGTKRVATSMRSNEGIVCERVVLNRGITTQWLEQLPDETPESVAVLVDPADHQNVPRAYKLIRAVISLGAEALSPSSDTSPTDHSTQRAFAMAGEMWRAFLDPFTKGSLSLSEALSDLSKFAHLAFYFYRQHGSSFLSNQLYGDLQAIVKAAFFCVAQQQILDPMQRFYLYQIGSDRLEEMFAEVRTESHDSNVDGLQLSERLSSAADSVRIWNEHPEWHQGHIRRSWSGKEADHVNPTFFTGDMNITSHVAIGKCWDGGGLAAANFLSEHGVEFDFDAALDVDGVDFLRPNGGNVYPGISKEKDRSIVADKTSESVSSTSTTPPLPLNDADIDIEEEDTRPFLPEDDAPTVFLEDFLPDEPTPSQDPPASGSPLVEAAPIYNDWLDYPLGNGATKRLHKASIIATLFNSDYKRLATTRLLRVRCYSKDGHRPSLNHVEISGEHSFSVGDPAVALIRTHNTVAAAVVRVTVLLKNNVRVGQVDVEDIGSADSQVSAMAQVLIMSDVYIPGRDGVESTRKWVWTGDYTKFEPLNGTVSAVEAGTRKALTIKVPGALLHPLDPEVEGIDVLPFLKKEEMRSKNHLTTSSVSDSDFSAIVSVMYENLDVQTLIQLLPKHGVCNDLPYLRYNGAAAFVLNAATQSLVQARKDNLEKIACFQCHAYIKPDDARSHVGGHILLAICGVQEPLLAEQVALPDPCGFCGRSGCKTDVVKKGKALKAVSECSRQHSFAYGHAKKYSAATPSTNVPIICELCLVLPPRKLRPVFWKYSMPGHIRAMHPRHWDDETDAPCNLDKDFADKIAIFREELAAFGIVVGLSTAPSATAEKA